MRIGFIVSAFTNGGAQRVAITLTKWLNSHGHEACIISLVESDMNQYDASGMTYYSLGKMYAGQSVQRRMKAFDESHDVDAYILMGVPMCIYVIPALRNTRAKIIVSERNDPRNFQGKAIIKVASRFLMRRADGFVFQTKDASDFYKRFQNKSTVIPNPVADVPMIRQRLSNAERKKRIVTAGRLVPQKNHEMLIHAFSMVSKDYPDYCLMIFGEGNLKESLESLAVRLGVQDRVFFPGSVNDVHEQIIDAELFVLSSDFEGMPNALMEAMAMGLTSISTDCPCGGPRDMIEDGVNGYLIPVGDQEACARAIRAALSDKTNSDRIGQRAMELRERLGKDTICEKWLEFIRKIVNK